MNFFIGLVVGVVLCGVAAKGYIMKVVADEKAKLGAQYEDLKSKIDARVAAVKSAAQGK